MLCPSSHIWNEQGESATIFFIIPYYFSNVQAEGNWDQEQHLNFHSSPLRSLPLRRQPHQPQHPCQKHQRPISPHPLAPPLQNPRPVRGIRDPLTRRMHRFSQVDHLLPQKRTEVEVIWWLIEKRRKSITGGGAYPQKTINTPVDFPGNIIQESQLVWEVHDLAQPQNRSEFAQGRQKQ